jgi:hypothetical protein
MRNTEAATWTMLAVSLTQTISVAAAVAPGEILDAYKVAAGGNAWDDKVTLETQFTTAGYGLRHRTFHRRFADRAFRKRIHVRPH